MTHSAAMSRGNAIALMNADLAQGIALATLLEFNKDGGVPEWIHLLPHGVANSFDERKPWQALNLERLAKASLEAAGGRLPVDENHSTDLVGKHGGSAPARGWIVQLEARETGLWGKVEWTQDGKSLLEGKAYRHISPVFTFDPKSRVINLVLRAALTNNPGFKFLTALNSAKAPNEEDMDFLEKLRAALGLANDADEGSVLAALEARLTSTVSSEAAETMTAQLSAVAKAAGLEGAATSQAVVAAVETLVAAGNGGGDETAIASLQAELVTMTEKFNTLNDSVLTARAEAAVDAAIVAGTVGIKPLRQHYIDRYVEDPKAVETEFATTPKVSDGALLTAKPPKDLDGNPGLTASQAEVAKQLGGISKSMTETLAAERTENQEAV